MSTTPSEPDAPGLPAPPEPASPAVLSEPPALGDPPAPAPDVSPAGVDGASDELHDANANVDPEIKTQVEKIRWRMMAM